MAMILTESGFITQSENKPESMFKVGDLIRPTLNNQFDGMSTDEIWEVVEVNGYDRMNGYIYTIKPNNDAAKSYRSENSTDGEAEGFAEIAGFENSPEEQAWTLAESKSINEDIDFEYDETSEEDQGLFDGIGTKVVDTLFPGVQFEPAEMEKLDEAIDLLIWVYKSVKSRSVKTTNESIDNKHYKNVNTVNGKSVVAANLSSEHKAYNDTYLGYVSFELDDGSDVCYPVDLDGNLVDDKNAWEFIKKQGLPKVTFSSRVIEAKDSSSAVIYAISNSEEPDVYEDSFWAWDTENDTGYELTTIENAIDSRDTFKTLKKAEERAIDILDSIEDNEVFVVELDNYSPYNPTGVFKKLPEDASIQIEEDVEQYYVYLDSPAGTELIGSGDKESCERIKAEKDKQWRKGYMWSTRIESKPEKETNYWD